MPLSDGFDAALIFSLPLSLLMLLYAMSAATAAVFIFRRAEYFSCFRPLMLSFEMLSAAFFFRRCFAIVAMAR